MRHEAIANTAKYTQVRTVRASMATPIARLAKHDSDIIHDSQAICRAIGYAHKTFTFGIRDAYRAVVCFSFQFYEGFVRFWQAKNGTYGNTAQVSPG